MEDIVKENDTGSWSVARLSSATVGKQRSMSAELRRSLSAPLRPPSAPGASSSTSRQQVKPQSAGSSRPRSEARARTPSASKSKAVLLWGGTNPAQPWQCRWPEPTQRLLHQKHANLPRTVPEILRYGNPRAGPLGDVNMERLAKAFPFRVSIAAVENRSVTVKQLSRVGNYAEAKCGLEWELDPKTISTYNIDEWLVRPVTKERNSALAEHLLTREQPANWFISHWWGEPFAHYMRSVRQHVVTRSLPEHAAFWVSAFAHKPHTASDSSCDSPRQFGAMRALRAARFKVLLVVDDTGATLNRLWCGFEVAMCLGHKSSVLDVATCNGREDALAVTSGLTQKEATVEQYRPGDGILLKVKREKPFPPEIVRSALDFTLQRCNTSFPEDRKKLLNSIVGQDMKLEPPEQHEKYEEVNRKMRKLFALTFYRITVSCEVPKAEHSKVAFLALQRQMCSSICMDLPCKSLSLCLAGCDVTDRDVWQLIRQSLPEGLQQLTLDFRATQANDGIVKEILNKLPETLTELALEVSSCEGFTDTGIQEIVSQFPESIVSLKLRALNTMVSPHTMYQAKDLRAPFWAKLNRYRESEVDQVSALEGLLASKMTFELRKGVVEKLKALGHDTLC